MSKLNKRLIIFTALILIIPFATSFSNTLVLNIVDNESVSIDSYRVAEGSPPETISRGKYRAVLMNEGEVMAEREFRFEQVKIHSPKPEWFNEENEQTVIPENTTNKGSNNKIVKIGYNSSVTAVEIRDSENETLDRLNLDKSKDIIGKNQLYIISLILAALLLIAIYLLRKRGNKFRSNLPF